VDKRRIPLMAIASESERSTHANEFRSLPSMHAKIADETTSLARATRVGTQEK
jgi:hypothetical protein